jgi:7-carboxy-7-deazaguanine synthase
MPALWKDDPKLDPDALADQIIAERYRTGAMRICLTGGEPLMQDNDTLRALISKLDRAELLIDIFSNGSFIYPEWLMRSPEVTIIMDWKLEGSGEAKTKLANRHINLRQLRTQDCVKFVVASPEDLAEAHGLWKEWYFVRATPYVGAAWSKIDDKTIVDYVLENRLPWVLNVQLHKHIWGEQRGV